MNAVADAHSARLITKAFLGWSNVILRNTISRKVDTDTHIRSIHRIVVDRSHPLTYQHSSLTSQSVYNEVKLYAIDLFGSNRLRASSAVCVFLRFAKVPRSLAAPSRSSCETELSIQRPNPPPSTNMKLLRELLSRTSTESESVMVKDKNILDTDFLPYSAHI